MGTLGGMAVTKRKKREVQPETPRPTVADVDSWLAQIDQVLDDAAEAPRKTA